MPKVSVAMSVYNGERYLAEAIESILNQTYSEFEFIICDDASNDRSVIIVEEYMKTDSRITLIRNEKNMGLAASLNRCIEVARGDYIARMDADDISFPNRFQEQISFLDNNPNIAFVCGGVHLIDENGVWGSRLSKTPLTKENVYKYQPIAHPTTMIRKDVLKEVDYYTVAPYTVRGQDFDLWCKIYARGYIGMNIGEFVLYYREDKDAYKRRRFKYRVDSYRIRKLWRLKLEFPLFYDIYAYKHIIAGLIPKSFMGKYHKKKFRSS
ncbi:glycosyltransferase family 2 protein [Ectobacillus ponti]|uniref:Glycosyltransferase n=1 Tax=Ectobacillus ponti TaxID=2961894 RepID=A0AA41X7R5_9BACI|nr:glycosyltransferase family 2 protein [Ectobacillus ponti]MCP8967838.1 glycosyltransferase [Ectobacillus ponti]